MIRSLPLLAIVTAFLLLCACAERRKSASDWEQRQAEVEAKFHEYAAQKGGSADWEKSLPGGSIDGSYTFQLEDALLGDKRPIVVRATLFDVRRRGETFYLSLQNHDEGIFLRLRATPEQISTILKQGSPMYDEYAVVVQVTGVDRPEFEAKAEADPDNGQRVEVDFSDMVVITGDCLGLQFLDGLPRGKVR
jgi:hypothetical protein